MTSLNDSLSRSTGMVRRIALALMLWLTMAAAAWAHASLAAAWPRDGSVIASAPAVISLSFSEPVSPTSLRLVKPDGSSVTLNRTALRDRRLEITPPPDLANGTYILSWRVVSEDGHPVGGSVVFSIGQPTAALTASRGEEIDWAVRAGLWIGKLCLYIGLFFGTGGVFAAHWFAEGSKHGNRAMLAALIAGVCGAILSAGFQGLDTAGVSVAHLTEAAPWSAGLTTSFGRTVVFAVAAFAASALAMAHGPGRDGRFIALGGLLTGAFALSLSGHASAAEPQWLMRPAVFLHAATIAVWIGALIPLAANFYAGSSSAPVALRRFSASIPVFLLVLAAAGIALSVIQVGKPEALLTTDYGSVLLVKLGLLLVLFVLAAVNRWRLTASAMDGEAKATRSLIRSIAAETMIALMIFGVAATWRFTPPPRVLEIAAAQPAMVHIHTDKAMAEVTVTPGRAGVVNASAMVLTAEFAPLEAQEVSFVFSNPASGIEPIRRKATKGENSNWTTEGFTLPLAGKWSVRVDVLISDFEIAKLDGEIEIRP